MPRREWLRGSSVPAGTSPQPRAFGRPARWMPYATTSTRRSETRATTRTSRSTRSTRRVCLSRRPRGHSSARYRGFPIPPRARTTRGDSSAMTKIAVTGGSGKAGRAVVRELLEHGHDVLNIDRVPSAESYSPDTPAPFLPAELTDFGQTLEALGGGERMPGIEAVVHLAAIPSPVAATPDQVFRTNTISTHTVFAAAARLGLRRVVWASSETTLGLPFDRPPDYAPVDEAHMYPESSYALSKVLGEEMARQFHRWSGIPFVGLRFSNVMVREDYEQFPSFWDDPHLRKWNLWGYVDESHVAQSVRLGLEADATGAESFIIAASDTVMQRPSRELMTEVFPGVPVADHVSGTDTLLGIEKAKRVLGYSPDFTWRELL